MLMLRKTAETIKFTVQTSPWSLLRKLNCSSNRRRSCQQWGIMRENKRSYQAQVIVAQYKSLLFHLEHTLRFSRLRRHHPRQGMMNPRKLHHVHDAHFAIFQQETIEKSRRPIVRYFLCQKERLRIYKKHHCDKFMRKNKCRSSLCKSKVKCHYLTTV